MSHTVHPPSSPSHLPGLRAQVKDFIIAALSSRSLNNLLKSLGARALTKQCLASALRPILNYQTGTYTGGGREPEVDLR